MFDLHIMSIQAGRDFMPYPLSLKSARFTDVESYEAYARQIPERLRDGDLSGYRNVIGMLLGNGDIRVGAYSYDYRDRSDRSVAGVRVGERGCLAIQSHDGGRVTLYELSAYYLGSAVAKSLRTGRPGAIAEGTIAGFTLEAPPVALPADDSVSVRHHGVSSERRLPKIGAEVYQVGTIETDWGIPRTWGRRSRVGVIKWVDTYEGAYLLTPEWDAATPLTEVAVRERIDRAIAADVKAIRESRHDKAMPD